LLGDARQSGADLVSQVSQRAAGRIELLHGINHPEHGDAVVTFEKHHVARQEQPRARIELDCLTREFWIAGSEDAVPAKVDCAVSVESWLFMMTGLRSVRANLYAKGSPGTDWC
jgi:hypothetical protein